MKENHYTLLFNHIRNNKITYILGVLSVLICNIGQVYFARAMGHVVDFFSSGNLPSFFDRFEKEDRYFYLFMSILAARVILLIGRIGWRLTLGRESHRISGVLKNRIWKFSRLFSYPDLSEKFSKGTLMNLATSDVNQAKFLFGFTLIGVIDVFFLTLLSIISMIAIDVKLTFISLFILGLTPIFIQKLSQLEIKLYETAQNSLSDFNDLTAQAVSTVRLQKLGNISTFWFEKLVSNAENYRSKRLEANLTSLKYYPYMGVASLFSYLILFSFGIYQFYMEIITVGEFVAMQGLIFLLQEPLTELGFVISEWRKSATSLKRLNTVFENPTEKYLTREGEVDTLNKDIVFDLQDISFSYDSTRTLISSLSLKVSKGDRLGIKGEIGTGKSTLVNILSGLERGFNGELFFYGNSIRSYGHEYLREAIGIVNQRPFVFATSIRNNVKMDLELSDEEVLFYLELAGLKDDVLDLEHGLDTELGEWGINISGGQKQRLSLARTLSRNPEVLLLDDCLSAVDTITENLILKRLDEYMSGKTIIWVAHRDSTLKYCDQIINMEAL